MLIMQLSCDINGALDAQQPTEEKKKPGRKWARENKDKKWHRVTVFENNTKSLILQHLRANQKIIPFYSSKLALFSFLKLEVDHFRIFIFFFSLFQ